MPQVQKVVVVGAGICGLSTAVACRAAGAQVEVFEAAPSISPLGTAISLWPNAQTCLDTWGLRDVVEGMGYPFSKIATRRIDGTAIFEVDLEPLHAKHERQSRCVTRADLHQALADHLPNGAIRLGASATGLTWSDDRATVTLDTDETIKADLIVVADGQNSTLRPHIVGESTLRYAGYGAVLGLADNWQRPPGWGNQAEACEYYGPNGRFGVFRLGPDRTYWFFVGSSVPQSTRAVATDVDWLMEQLREWPAFTRDLVANTPPDRMPQVSFHDRTPAPHWGNGRVLLAGDAAHPMIPNFGQGANQAIEDAHAIGLGLAAHHSGAALASFYTKMRKRRVEKFVTESRQNGQLTQQEGPFGKWMRNGFMRMVPKSMVRRQLDRQFTLPTP